MMARRWMGRIAAVAIVVAIAGAAVFWWSRPTPAPAATAPPPPQVGVAELAAADVPLPLDFSGRVAGFRVVEIPIVFEDRRVGQSKMSRKIFLEGLTMVWKLRFTV